MSTQAFLSAVLPKQGHYYLVVFSGDKHKHIPFSNIDQLAATAKEVADTGYDTYFAVAAFKAPNVVENGRVRFRVKTNVRALQSVVFDIDVAANDPKKYASKQEALEATIKFFKALGWPAPYVVDSGNGLHLYVPLTEEVSPDTYQELMRKLKAVASHLNYMLDAACTDVTRILRVVGTYNYKDARNPKPVRLLKQASKRVSVADLQASLDNYIIEHGLTDAIPARKTVAVPEYLRCGRNLYRDIDTPLDLLSIQKQCGVISNFVDLGGHVPYKYWLHVLQVVRHCDDGRHAAHVLSAPSSKYDKHATDYILDALEQKDIPPTLCDTFATLDDTSAICKVCPHRGRISTPAVLGRNTQAIREARRKEEAAMVIATGEMPPPPYPFEIDDKEGIIRSVKDKNGNIRRVVVYPYQITPVRRIFSERAKEEIIVWRITNPSDGTRDISVEASKFYDRRACIVDFAKEGVYVSLQHVDDLRDYLISYAHAVQQHYSRAHMVARVGWREEFEQFAYGDLLYNIDGTTTPCLMDMSARVHEALVTSGTLEGWRKIIEFYEHPEFASHQFALGTAFGSVLMPFTGLSGGIINIVGQSGEGKSTIQKIINSVWGHPLHLMLPAEGSASTYNAKISFINQMNNLPICAEEITNASAEDVGMLAYAITQGSEKWRADKNGQVRESLGGWCTTMLSSANTSLYEKLYNSGGAFAKALRILEYRLPHVRKHNVVEFRTGVDIALINHYGHAGRVYLQYIMPRMDEIKSHLATILDNLDTRHQFKPEERVWSAIIATNLLGLHLAKKCGLHNFDMRAIDAFVDNLVVQLRESIADMAMSPIDMLTRFIHENVGGLLLVEQQAGGKLFIIHTPRNQLIARYDVSMRKLYVTHASLRQWCQESNIGYLDMLSQLKEDNVHVSHSRVRLSQGTDLPSVQPRCVAFDLSRVADEKIESIQSNIVALRRG